MDFIEQKDICKRLFTATQIIGTSVTPEERNKRHEIKYSANLSLT